MKFSLVAFALIAASTAQAHTGAHPSPLGHQNLIPAALFAIALLAYALVRHRRKAQDVRIKSSKTGTYRGRK